MFPHVRPGGLFVVEDWRCDHTLSDSIVELVERDESGRLAAALRVQAEAVGERKSGPPRPLSDLAFELLLAQAAINDAVAELRIDSDWIVVRRGDAPLDPATFRITDIYRDHFNQLNRDGVRTNETASPDQ